MIFSVLFRWLVNLAGRNNLHPKLNESDGINGIKSQGRILNPGFRCGASGN